MSFGKGRWPSLKTVEHLKILGGLCGPGAPGEIGLGSLYGQAFLYADKTQNGGEFSGSTDQLQNDPACIERYFEAVAGGAKPLDFTLYVPKGYGSPGTQAIPNVLETDEPGNPDRFRNHFCSVTMEYVHLRGNGCPLSAGICVSLDNGGKEVW